jgi:alpha-glucosidase
MTRHFNLFLGLSAVGPMLALLPNAAAQSSYSVRSPDGRIEIRIRTAERISYDVLLHGRPRLRDCTMSIDIDRTRLGAKSTVKSVAQRSVDRVLTAAVRRKSAVIRENYNEIRIQTEEPLAVTFRAYNEGVAYRLETSLAAEQVKVYDEEVSFRFTENDKVFYPQEESFLSHNERLYLPHFLREIVAGDIASLPAVVDAGDGAKIAVAESDIEDYAGMWLRGTGANGLAATFPHYPLKERLEKDRTLRVTETADYIAVTKGTRTYPWRVLGIADKDGDLISNDIVWLLAKPSMVEDTSWIKPGKVAWDWWNANNVFDVDFKSGINTETYKYYIDFAAKHNLQYVILDEGWYRLGNVLDVVPTINMEELTAYARQKNVGIILWVVWKTLADQMIPALDQYAKWGVKGIKVDFMQRDDQPLINFYHELSRECAKRKMLVDFHGAQRPALLTRTWPNLISTEGVRGMEWSKWSADANPDHDLTLPFTRMFLGPMDYTPGAMRNAQRNMFAPIFDRPMSQGTRCHQLAMYAVFESPLQMLSDSPSNYLHEPEAMEFLSAVPSVWDETRVLDGRIGEYVVVARRSGRDWYIGAMTNWTARELEVDLAFLSDGQWKMDAYQDGVNAGRQASDYKRVVKDVTAASKMMVQLAPGGGWVARIQSGRAIPLQ